MGDGVYSDTKSAALPVDNRVELAQGIATTEHAHVVLNEVDLVLRIYIYLITSCIGYVLEHLCMVCPLPRDPHEVNFANVAVPGPYIVRRVTNAIRMTNCYTGALFL